VPESPATRRRGRPIRTTDLDPDLARTLRDIATEIERKKGQIRQLEQERNALIARALDANWSHGQIASMSGVTRGRIGQIALSDE
jgi:hypothetical protein